MQRIAYLLDATANALYGGKFALGERFRTYGQHSFLYDLIVSAARCGLHVDLFIRGLESFPIVKPLSRFCTVRDAESKRLDEGTWDSAVADVVSDDLLSRLPTNIPVLAIVHNGFQQLSSFLVKRCHRFVCLSQFSFEYKARSIAASRLLFIPQGVDLQRFRPSRTPTSSPARTRILVSSRLADEKEQAVYDLIAMLSTRRWDLTVLGDGPGFWRVSDEFASFVTTINFIPCHSIHNFLAQFDLVCSSGRGVMEALACGKAAIAVGRSYCGAVLPGNVQALMRLNFTGRPDEPTGVAVSVPRLEEDLNAALLVTPEARRKIAEEYFDVDRFLRELLRSLNQ